ncbi:hypothetical protein [Psychrobacter sp. Pi2-51]|nr:hypothetical protein [Psychrobacter sp. Pi2-51]
MNKAKLTIKAKLSSALTSLKSASYVRQTAFTLTFSVIIAILPATVQAATY